MYSYGVEEGAGALLTALRRRFFAGSVLCGGLLTAGRLRWVLLHGRSTVEKVVHLPCRANIGPSANGPVVRFAYFCGMKRADVGPLVIGSIPEFCRLLELPPPEHPLVNVIRLESIRPLPVDLPKTVVLNFFSIWLKKGQQEGLMQFFLPGHGIPRDAEGCGIWLLIHPELLLNYSVDKNLEQYGFFAAAVAETLRLGGEEERLIRGILQNIEQEYLPPVNICCQEAILSHVETLFCYADRCYRRRSIS